MQNSKELNRVDDTAKAIIAGIRANQSLAQLKGLINTFSSYEKSNGKSFINDVFSYGTLLLHTVDKLTRDNLVHREEIFWFLVEEKGASLGSQGTATPLSSVLANYFPNYLSNELNLDKGEGLEFVRKIIRCSDPKILNFQPGGPHTDSGTLLHKVISRNHFHWPVFIFLVSEGANLRLKNAFGATPIDVLKIQFVDAQRNNLLPEALKNISPEQINEEFILEYAAKFKEEHPENQLHTACFRN